ncbi:MAG: 16S rRNA (guanine(527)-N(7))-methyltransferase RsmG [Rickettsia endosymbiont of Bryobia graminum]|nr:16S rRNA (guanine(527)-N(7))-methyltransferase RsmG [Rickettsia endosymbiont of Bryobia graminum]
MLDLNNIPRETIEALKKYQSLVLKWNKVINLVSYSTEAEFWTRHILDSLQLMKYINNFDNTIVDIGSGAGLPGIILSIAGIRNVTLIESDERKVSFLIQATKCSNNKINIINDRIENVVLECDIVTSRAFAPLEKIFSYTKNIRVKDKYLLLKGQKYQEEITNAKKKWLFNHLTYDSMTSNNSKIIEISNLEKIA